MKTPVLLGNRDTKRTTYFEHAARQMGLHVLFLGWEDWLRNGFPGNDREYLVKIDPPVWDSCYLDELKTLTGEYINRLNILKQEPAAAYFNRPEDMIDLLDKKSCKKRLKEANLPVTEALEGPMDNAGQLLETMKALHIHQVFLKPAFGSGAAGVTAFRFNPRTGQMAAYTCAMQDPSTRRLVNTKRLRSFTRAEDILPLLDCLLSLDCVAERWYAKADHKGGSYDLRAVCQGGRVDFLLARLSKGPITNLHLNNHPLKAEDLGLPESVRQSVTDICLRASGCYPGLKSVGIDILLEKGSLIPRIIEMNGQGDLLYQDIYNENAIYLHQASMMREWQEQGENK